MKPAPFKYVAAESVDEVVSALSEHGDEAKILAGGQSLVPLMNLRLAVPGVLVDVNRVAELRGITANGTVQLSYCAANTRKTKTVPNTNTKTPVLPAVISSKVNSVHSKLIDDGNSWYATCSIIAIACPVLVPGSRLPLIAAEGYML